jgi:hypothetical protein
MESVPFGPEVLLLFVGHSADAAEEARAIAALERELGRELERLQVASQTLPFKTVRCWQWNSDAPPTVGGQRAAINPYLDRANMALFVFKERIGEVTWSELERARGRKNPSIPVVAFFPENPPDNTRMSDLLVVQGWMNLLQKRRGLSEDWAAEDSRSLRPTPTYLDIEHLKKIVLEQMKNGLSTILQASLPRTTHDEVSPTRRAFLGEETHLSYDGRPVLRHTLEELDSVLVRRFLERPLSADQLAQLGFTDTDSNHRIPEKLRVMCCACDGRPTLGAFLCFAPAVLLVDKLEACGLQLVTYDRVQRAGSSPNIEIVRGNLLTLYSEGLAWLKTRAGLSRRGHVGKADRDELEIPEIVLHEALANALVHRDYETEQLRHQPTRIEVYPDRVEITSFGALPAAVPIESLNDESENPVPWRKNPVIARIFQHLSLVELNASGVSRMRLEMERASLAFPRFVAKLHDSVVRVVLLRPPRATGAEVIVASRRTRQRGQLSALISSAITDLPDHRQKVIETCTALGVFPVSAGQDDAAVGAPALADAILRADVFVGVYGRRYGAILNEGGKSTTELEYEAARARGLPLLLFIMDEEHPVTRGMLETDELAAKKLAAFKEHLRQHHLISTFSSSADLQHAVAQSLAVLLQQMENERQQDPADRSTGIRPPDLSAESAYVGSHQFTGREDEIATLNDWANPSAPYPVMLIDAIGGSGKSMLSWQWLTEHATHSRKDWAGRFWYSFYEAGSGGRDFCVRAIAYMANESERELRQRNAVDLQHQLLGLLRSKPWLLVLDGLERILIAYLPQDDLGEREDLSPDDVAHETDGGFLQRLTREMPSKVLITSRLVPRPMLNASGQLMPGVQRLRLTGLRPVDAEALLRASGVHGDSVTVQQYLAEHCDCHPLLVGAIAGLVNDYLPARGDFVAWASDPNAGGRGELITAPLFAQRNHILTAAVAALPEEHMRLLSLIALTSHEIDYATLLILFRTPGQDADTLSSPESEVSLITVVRNLERRGLLSYDALAKRYGLHPVVRAYVLGLLTTSERNNYGQRVTDAFAALPSQEREKAGKYTERKRSDPSDNDS